MYRNIYIYIPSGIDNGAEVVDWMYLQTELFLAFQMERKLVELIELDVRHPYAEVTVYTCDLISCEGTFCDRGRWRLHYLCDIAPFSMNVIYLVLQKYFIHLH